MEDRGGDDFELVFQVFHAGVACNADAVIGKAKAYAYVLAGEDALHVFDGVGLKPARTHDGLNHGVETRYLWQLPVAAIDQRGDAYDALREVQGLEVDFDVIGERKRGDALIGNFCLLDDFARLTHFVVGEAELFHLIGCVDGNVRCGIKGGFEGGFCDALGDFARHGELGALHVARFNEGFLAELGVGEHSGGGNFKNALGFSWCAGACAAINACDKAGGHGRG